MEEKRLIIKEIRSGIYLLDEAGESTGYLVVGAEKACLIDTMNGYNDLQVMLFIIHFLYRKESIFNRMITESAIIK